MTRRHAWTWGREEFLRQNKKYKTRSMYQKMIDLIVLKLKLLFNKNISKIKRQATVLEKIFATCN